MPFIENCIFPCINYILYPTCLGMGFPYCPFFGTLHTCFEISSMWGYTTKFEFMLIFVAIMYI